MISKYDIFRYTDDAVIAQGVLSLACGMSLACTETLKKTVFNVRYKCEAINQYVFVTMTAEDEKARTTRTISLQFNTQGALMHETVTDERDCS